MSGSRKGLKVISIIMIIFSILTFLLGVLSVLGIGASWVPDFVSDFSTRNRTNAEVAGAAGLMIFAGITWLFSGLLYLMIGIFGLRGASSPSKIMPFYVLSVIGLILCVMGIIGNAVLGVLAETAPTTIPGLVLFAVCVLLAHNIKKQRDPIYA